MKFQYAIFKVEFGTIKLKYLKFKCENDKSNYTFPENKKKAVDTASFLFDIYFLKLYFSIKFCISNA